MTRPNVAASKGMARRPPLAGEGEGKPHHGQERRERGQGARRERRHGPRPPIDDGVGVDEDGKGGGHQDTATGGDHHAQRRRNPDTGKMAGRPRCLLVPRPEQGQGDRRGRVEEEPGPERDVVVVEPVPMEEGGDPEERGERDDRQPTHRHSVPPSVDQATGEEPRSRQVGATHDQSGEVGGDGPRPSRWVRFGNPKRRAKAATSTGTMTSANTRVGSSRRSWSSRAVTVSSVTGTDRTVTPPVRLA